MNAETWLWLDTGDNAAAMNMAIDEALLQNAVRCSRPLLRVYGWSRPSISIGYFQAYPSDYEDDYDIVRRPTGGGLVWHGKDLTFTVIAPPNHELCAHRVCDSYRTIHSLIAFALNGAGVRCILADDPAAETHGACFERPVAHDIMIGGKKITGGAQRRTKFGLVHQGSLLLPPSLRRPIAELKRALYNGFGATWIEANLTESDQQLAAELSRTKYATTAWNRRFTEVRQSAVLPRAP